MSKPVSRTRKAALPTITVPTTTLAFEADSRNLIDSANQFKSPTRAKGITIPRVNLKKAEEPKKMPENTWNYFDQTGTTMPTTERLMFGEPITADTARKRVMVLGYTNKVKNQKRLNEIYTNEKLMEKNYKAYGLNARKFSNINDQGLSIGTEVANTPKQVKLISPSNLISNKTVKMIQMAVNYDTRTSQASDRTGKSISDIDYQNPLTKGRVLTHETLYGGEKGRNTTSSLKGEIVMSARNKDEKEIKELNERIRNTIQNGVSTQPTPGLTPGLDSFMSKTKTNLVKRKAERASTLVLFDHDLEFMKDYLIEYQLALRLVFDKLEDYGSTAHLSLEERHDSPLKKGTYLPYHCIFVFLKCSPKVNTKSFEVVQDLIKRKCCYVIKCALPSDKSKLNLNYQDEEIDDEWKRKKETTLTMTLSKFGAYSIEFTQFNALKEFVLTNAKSHLE